MARATFLRCTLQHHLVPLVRHLSERRLKLYVGDEPTRVILPPGWQLSPATPPLLIAAQVPGARSNVWQLTGTNIGMTAITAENPVLSIRVILTVFVAVLP